MTLWSSIEAEKATGGVSTQSWQALDIAIAPGSVKPGDLFVPLGGDPVVDVALAFDRGAAAAIVNIWPEGFDKTHPLLIVDDPRAALHRLAATALKRCAPRRIVVTGAGARSGLMEMCAAALSATGQIHTVSTDEGMMLGLARMHAGCDYVLFDENENEETVVSGDIVVRAVRDFGALEGVELQACLEASNGTRLRALIGGEEISLTVPQPGIQTAVHALNALSLVKALDGDLAKAAKALIRAQENPERAHGGPVTLIEDAANHACGPAHQAFKVLALVDPGRGRKRIAILSHLNHEAANDRGSDLPLPLQTGDVRLIYTKAPRGRSGHNHTGLQEIVPDVLAPGDVLMLKGANETGKGVVMEALRVPPPVN
ncbi:MAG: hypothetical protein H6868_04435 [Rhodospirillales bacterium]|nr:hypothetical protein [Rhodospirillales bacterium]